MSPIPQTVSLSPVAENESLQIRHVAEKTWPTAYGDIITQRQIDYMLGWMYSLETLTREIREGNIHYYWLEVPDRVGFLAIGPIERGRIAHLHKFYLLPDFQRSGYGSKAFAALFELLTEKGVSGVELRVNRNNQKAIAFYRKNQFEIIREDCADIGGGFVMDDFIMFRSLKQS
ncbi:MAG: GNAT family N-acetyltransferase [Verrucomicrobiales bacterium]|nr:GNAT family N-acetyltransferase [Verrucomicrobiales bacterium]